MIYVDSLMPCQISKRWPFAEACHLFCAVEMDLEKLHAFAGRLGLKRGWFQSHKDLPHYDLTRSKRALAVRLGAVELDRKETVRRIHAWRAARSAPMRQAELI